MPVKKVRKIKIHNPLKPRIKDETNLREYLALERTKLANERTLLSYTKASLYLLVGGIAILQLKEYPNLQGIGYMALVFSVLFIVIGIARYVILEKKLKNLLLPDKSDIEPKKK
ncbi:putative membrane protein [Mesonia hippocampi]|uniref:Putative membrane protein n=1 Tax=Mesonia hippocampi TaxID=1628250 RepID=A0A840EP00_9FLAO|nr:DUF202 domain-containing protein [Mesonia hippocampi]MBB4118700.1 putative membrane protein [Mesonia hippocampi]